MKRLLRAAALAVVMAAATITPTPAEGTAIPAPPVVDDARFVEWPTAVVVPVATTAPAPLEATQTAFDVPTAISGRALAWPRLHLGETGVISHYGDPRFDAYVALPFPWGAGYDVTICGPGGCWSGVSNDMGPIRELHRIADLGVPIWERVCGVPASFGLCVATVTVTGRAE